MSRSVTITIDVTLRVAFNLKLVYVRACRAESSRLQYREALEVQGVVTTSPEIKTRFCLATPLRLAHPQRPADIATGNVD